MTDRPISEQYRVAAKDWVLADSAARLLEEMKTATLSQMMKELGDMPVSSAERDVKSSDKWKSYISDMVDARKEANMAKVKLEWVRMRFQEQMSTEASKRHEMKL